MSADNWATCPRCLSRADAAAEEERERVMASYGNVPIEEFEKAREALEPVEPKDFASFREDYEFYGAEDGEIHARYSGACSVCGLSVQLEHSERFWTRPSAAETQPSESEAGDG